MNQRKCKTDFETSKIGTKNYWNKLLLGNLGSLMPGEYADELFVKLKIEK